MGHDWLLEPLSSLPPTAGLAGVGWVGGYKAGGGGEAPRTALSWLAPFPRPPPGGHVWVSALRRRELSCCGAAGGRGEGRAEAVSLTRPVGGPAWFGWGGGMDPAREEGAPRAGP